MAAPTRVRAGAAPGGGKAGAFTVVGSGFGGPDEMATVLDESAVQFGMFRIALGSGTFAKSKLVFVHFNGESCSAVKRGRFNTKKGDAKAVLGSTHAELIMSEKEEANIEDILTKLKGVIGADDMGEFSVSKMKEDLEAAIRMNRVAALSSVGDSPIKASRKTIAEMETKVDGDRAMKAVREPLGPLNWALFEPLSAAKPVLYNAGSQSVAEMQKWLKDDQVLAGLVRMGFGSGKFRRTKFISIWWSGEKVSPVKRGQANAKKGEWAKVLAPVSVDVGASEADEVSLEIIIDKVRKAAIIDGDATGEDDPFSLDKFMEALQEEQAANREFFGETDDGSTVEQDVMETIKSVRDDAPGSLGWVLLGIK